MQGARGHGHRQRHLEKLVLPRIHRDLHGHAQRRRCSGDGPRIPAGNCSATIASRGPGEGVAGARRPGHRVAGHPQPKRGVGSREPSKQSGSAGGPRDLGRRPFGHVGNRQQQIVFLQRLAIVRAVQSGLDLVRRTWLTLFKFPTRERFGFGNHGTGRDGLPR